MATETQILISAQDKATDALMKVSKSLSDMQSKLSGVARTADGMNSSLNKTKSAAMSLENVFGSFGGKAIYFAAMGAAINTLSNAFSNAGDALIGYNAKMEQTRVGLETMIGDPLAASVFIDKMKDFAAVTPFQFRDVDEASKKMMAFGWELGRVIPDLTTIGNAVAALGTGKEGIDRIVLAFGQMSQKVKVSGQEIRQLQEAGISAQQYLTKAFNLTADAFDDLSETGITGYQAMQAILKEMANDPKFKDQMDRQSKTFLGLWSTVKDVSSEVFGKIGESLFRSMQSAMVGVAETMQNFVKSMREIGLAGAIEEIFGSKVADMVYRIERTFGQLIDTISALGAVAIPILSPIAGKLFEIGDTLAFNVLTYTEKFFVLCSENLPAIEKGVLAVAAAFAVLKAEAMWVTVLGVGTALAEMAAALSIIATEGIGAAAVLATVGGAGGKLAAIIARITAPVTLLAAAIAGVVLAGNDLSTKAVQDVSDAKTMMTADFGEIELAANRVANAVRSIRPVTAADLREATFSSEEMALKADKDFAWAKAVADSMDRAAAARNAMGAGSSKGADKLGNAEQRVAEVLARIEEKTAEAIGSKPAIALAKLNKELVKAANVVEDAKKVGADTSALEAALDKYKAVYEAKMSKDLLQAQKEFAAETMVLSARTSGDRLAIADAEYNATITRLAKEREQWSNNLELTEKDKVLALDRYNAAVEAAAKKRKDVYDAEVFVVIELERVKNEVAYAMGEKTYQDFVYFDRKKLDEALKNVRLQLDNEKLAVEERLKLKRQEAELIKAIEKKPLTPQEGMAVGLQKSREQFGTWAENVQQLTIAAATGMRDAFGDFFFDAMTGKLKTLGDYFTSFFQSIGKAISNLMANLFATRILELIFPGIKLPGRAVGGPVYAGQTYLVGEKGPELLRMGGSDGNIVPNHALAAAGGGGAQIEVNVINNSGTPVQAKSEARFDGARTVITLFLEGYERNIGGIRTMMPQMSKG